MKGFPVLISFCLISLVSCFPDDEMPVGFQDFEIQRLLASDSTKIWDRFSRTENGFEFTSDSCNLDDVIVFNRSDNSVNSIVLDSTCTDSLIFSGFWEVLQASTSMTADSIRVAYLRDQLVLDSIYDEMDTTMLIGIDTSTVPVPDTLYWILEETTSQFLTYSYLDTLLFPFYLESGDTTLFFLDTIPLEVTEKYRFFP